MTYYGLVTKYIHKKLPTLPSEEGSVSPSLLNQVVKRNHSSMVDINNIPPETSSSFQKRRKDKDGKTERFLLASQASSGSQTPAIIKINWQKRQNNLLKYTNVFLRVGWDIKDGGRSI